MNCNFLKNNIRHIRLFPFFLILFLSVQPLFAQRHNSNQVIRAYPAIGATASQIRGDELRGFDKWGFTAGVGAMVSLSSDDTWQLSMEAVFSQRGAYNNTNNPYSLIGFTLNYVDIPLTLHFTDPFGGMTFGIGIDYSRLVQQPHGLIFYSDNYFIPDTSDMSFLKNDIALAVDVRFPVWRGLMLNFRYQHSIFPVKKDWHFKEYYSGNRGRFEEWSNNCYNSSVSLRLIYVFGDNHTARRTNKHKKRH